MTTSREPLHIGGEQRMEIPPLPPIDAGELFLQRALAVRRDLTSPQDGTATSNCQRLDGLPLALELAAARIAVFGPRALEHRLAERPSFRQAQGPARAPANAACDDRLELSAARARAAAAVRAAGAVPRWRPARSAEALWVRRRSRLISLAAKSLLRRREDPDGEPRFWMLETVREYAVGQAVSSGRLPQILEQHALHQLLFSDRAAAGLEGREQRYWLERIEHELPNLRGALEHLDIRLLAPQSVEMAANLTRFWEIRSYHLEAKERLLAALEAYLTREPPLCESIGQLCHDRAAYWRARSRAAACVGRVGNGSGRAKAV